MDVTVNSLLDLKVDYKKKSFGIYSICFTILSYSMVFNVTEIAPGGDGYNLIFWQLILNDMRNQEADFSRAPRYTIE